TLVTLTSFTAMGMDRKVLLTWATASEVDSMGFNILRGTSPDGPFTRINDWVIRSKGTATRGMTYTHQDSDVKNGTTYFYRLENVDINGRIAAHMIASTTPSAPAVAEEAPETSEPLSSAEAAPSAEEMPEAQPGSEALTGVIIYQEVPAAAGTEAPSEIFEAPLTGEEGEAVLGEATDTGKETLEAMPVIRDKVLEGGPAISEPAAEARREAPQRFTLKIADEAGNEMEVRRPEETESVQDDLFEVVVSEDGKIALKWLAKGNLKGFNVLRGEAQQGEEAVKEHVKVNLLPIPFFASQSGDHGLVYQFKDAGITPGKVYSYEVETIFSDGTSILSSPLKISISGTENAN
ncbi:MAG: hypothetical protein U0940_02530, partial [Nitrospirota bacterium]|nr:hypothetical protein [Nitrospirota bacterium]